MRRFILGVVVLLAAGQAGAEISTGPYGSLVMVDSTGKIVGGVTDIGVPRINDTRLTTVTLDTSQGAGFLYHSTEKSTFHRGSEIVMFTSTNCDGPAYAYSFDLSPGLDGGLGLVAVPRPPELLLYAATGPETTDVTQSYLYNGTCTVAGSSSENWHPVIPVAYVGDLSAEFTPPFSIESVPVVIDSDPIQVGIPLPQWFGLLVVGFLFGVFYMKGKYDGRVVQAG